MAASCIMIESNARFRVGYDPQMFSFFTRSGVAKYFAQLSCLMPNYGWQTYFPFRFSINEHYFELGGRQLRRIPPFKGARRVCRLLNNRSVVDRDQFAVWHSTFYDSELLDIYGDTGLVVTVHDMIPELLPQYFPNNPHAGKEEYVRRARRIIAISNHTREDVCRLYGVDPSRVDVVYHGIDPSTCYTSPMILPDNYILFIGARDGYKNFDRLLEAYAGLVVRHPDLKLVCIGVRDFSATEISRIRSLGLSGVVHANADDAHMRYALRKARVFVYPSLYEGFGMPIIEAMVQRCPMALADASCFPEIARDAAIYFDPENVDSIRDSLDTLLSDVVCRNVLVERGVALMGEYSISLMLQRTAEVYEKAI